jgi:hypothetical protein
LCFSFLRSPAAGSGETDFHSRRRRTARQLVKKVPLDFFAKLLSELQNHFLQHDFAILPLRRVMERERKP